jgi:hypothetical protein
MQIHRFTRWMLSILALVLVVVMVADAASAGSRRSKRSKSKSAPSQTVAVLAFEIEGGARAQIEKLTHESISRSLQADGLSAVSHEDVKKALRKKPELLGCTTPACLEKIAKLVGAERFVKLEVEASAGAYTFEIEVMGMDGESRKSSGTCPVCTVSEAGEQIGAAVAVALAGPGEEPVGDVPVVTGDPVVQIVTDPPAARLRIDGKDIGVAPYRGSLAPGPHRIVASRDGYEAVEMDIDVAAGKADVQSFEVTLTARATVPPPPPPSRPFRAIKWAGAGASVGALAWGGVWIAVHGKGTCDGPIETCPEIYDTRTPGLVIAGAGLVLGAVTTWMFLSDRNGSGTEIMVTPTSGGAMGSVKLRF